MTRDEANDCLFEYFESCYNNFSSNFAMRECVFGILVFGFEGINRVGINITVSQSISFCSKAAF